MQKWKCTSAGDGSWSFKKGAVYSTNERGQLIDGDGDNRMPPETYNRFGEGSEGRVPSFIEYIPKLENK